MSKFGWSYPPGAANDPNAPWNQDEKSTLLQDTILDLLSEAQLPQTIQDKILALIVEGEAALQQAEDDAYAEQLADEQRLEQEYHEWREQNQQED
jgi:hypothetical protein